MKLKLTLNRPGGDAVDLAVTAEQTSSVADVARELHNADPLRKAAVKGVAETLTLRVHDAGAERLLDPLSTIHDSRLGSGAVVSLAAASEQKAVGGTAVAAVVTIASGSATGKTFSLPTGSSTIGRDSSARIVIDDPLVSKVHLRINVSDVAEIIDLGSANGTLVNGEQVDRALLLRDDHVAIGDTVFTIAVSAQSAAADLGGVVQLNRSPRLDLQYVGPKFKAPEPPERPHAQRLPILALLAPLLVGVVLFLATQNLLSIVFVALSPVLMIATYVDNRVQNGRIWKAARADFELSIETLSGSIHTEHEKEQAGRMAEMPSVAEVVADAAARGSLLWTRRPEHDSFLRLRLGLATLPSRVELEMPHDRKGAQALWGMVEELRSQVSAVDSVPVVESLSVSGNIGVAGTGTISAGVARGIVAQLVTLHSPAELVVMALTSVSSSTAWNWVKWLPHVGSTHSPIAAYPLATGGQGTAALVSELEELISVRAEADRDASAQHLPVVLVIVEDDAPFDRSRVVALAETGPAVGVHLLWVSPSVSRLPAACRTFVELAASEGSALAGFVHTGQGVQPVDCESLSEKAAEAFARSLAPVMDAGARVDDASDLPRSVSLLHLIGTDLASDSEAVIGRWNETNSILTGPRASSAIGKVRPNLRAVFGQAAAEPFALDLRADGPHALVGGTTGSGKSEFLQAWVLALAAAHSPQRVSFLFVDYKGGSAFADCVRLPHTVGLVTDLSQHLVRRALASLRAELHYRERLLNRKKVKDILELERLGDPEVPPSLLIVIDEFAALVNEVPEFVDGVVDVAQRGRSLGLHLILATQRPAGVIRDNLRANTNLRIALRMADEDDSTDVLGTPMAASFDSSIPGRAAAKTGPGRIRSFQSGFAGGWTTDVAEPSGVRIEELSFGLPSTWVPPKDEVAEAAKEAASARPTDIKRIVATVRQASKDAAIPALRKPWLEPLAPAYDVAKLPSKRTDEDLVLGVVDDAAHQAQPTISYFPDKDGNMAIIGTGGAGKSTALRTIAVSAAITRRGGPVHVYGLDFAAGGLQMLEALPHVGAVINGDDDERVARLLRFLRDLVDQRSVAYAAARAGTIADYRRLASKPDEPRVLLLLDGVGAFREAYESNTSTPWFSVFSQIATDGRAVGVHVIVTGDRSGSIPTSLSSSIQRRLVLRMASPDDYSMLNVANDVLGPLSPPGRGVLDDLETQIGVLGGDPNVAVQAREIEKLATAMLDAGVAAAPSIERLADEIELAALPELVDSRATIGVADDNLMPVGIEAVGGFVIAGPPGSGRTTALGTVASAVQRANPKTKTFLLSPRRSSLVRLSGWSATADNEDEAAKVIAQISAALDAKSLAPGSVAIFLESLADFVGSGVEYDLEALIKLALKREQFVAAESETSTWSQAYSLGSPLRAGRKGILLQPDDSDGDVLLSTPTGRIRRGSLPVGRGFLIGQGRARRLQVALHG